MKESIGPCTPDDLTDRDANGVADEAERAFAETAEVQPSPGELELPSTANHPEEEGTLAPGALNPRR